MLRIMSPGYGFVIGRLRRNVRKEYSIPGNIINDIVQSYLFPRNTLMRIENEMGTRELKFLKRMDSGESSGHNRVAFNYYPYCLTPSCCDHRWHSRKGIDGGLVTAPPVPPMPSDFSNPPVAETDLPNSPKSPGMPSAEASLADSSTEISTTSKVSSTRAVEEEGGPHDIEQDGVPGQIMPPHAHGLHDDPYLETSSARAHDLHSDSWFSRWLWRPTHELHDDVHLETRSRNPHTLHSDALAESAGPVAHEIHDDSYVTNIPGSSHALHEDSYVINMPGSSHALHDDVTSSRDVLRPPHELSKDHFAQMAQQEPHILQGDQLVDFSGVNDRVRDDKLIEDERVKKI